MEYEKCPICGSELKSDMEFDSVKYIWKYNCKRCGQYKITEPGLIDLNIQVKIIDEEKIANISGWIRENQGSDLILTSEKIKSLITLKNLSVAEKADKILKYLAKQYPVAGSEIDPLLFRLTYMSESGDILINQDFAQKSLPIAGSGNVVDNFELYFILVDYLINTKEFIYPESPYKITPKGWAYLESLRQANPESKKAFVAMWFTDEMKEICESYIKKAAEKAGGYKAAPINEKDYNGDINDQIIGEIRNSKFVIADFTGNRGGVYFEAGFAYGLNIPVIYTCRKDWFNKFVKQSIKIKDSKGKVDDNELNIFSQIHFDINHHNFIVWENGDDLYEQLAKRIKATIT